MSKEKDFKEKDFRAWIFTKVLETRCKDLGLVFNIKPHGLDSIIKESEAAKYVLNKFWLCKKNNSLDSKIMVALSMKEIANIKDMYKNIIEIFFNVNNNEMTVMDEIIKELFVYVFDSEESGIISNLVGLLIISIDYNKQDYGKKYGSVKFLQPRHYLPRSGNLFLC